MHSHILHSDARSPICLKSAVQFCGDSTTNLPKSDSRLLIWLVLILHEEMRAKNDDCYLQIARIAPVMKICDEEKLMGHLGVVLYEYLGEEYPEVLGSIIGALKSIANVIGMTKMTPPIKDLLPRLEAIHSLFIALFISD